MSSRSRTSKGKRLTSTSVSFATDGILPVTFSETVCAEKKHERYHIREERLELFRDLICDLETLGHVELKKFLSNFEYLFGV